MELQPILGIKKGVTAVIGSGGKSTLLHTLAQELPGRILLCTSTHFMPYDDLPTLTEPTEETLRQAFTAGRVVCAGRETAKGKLTDCGTMVFDNTKQDVHAGGSGCGCSAITLCGYLLGQLSTGKLKKILFCGTGALLSPTSTQQGLPIPGVCHAVCLTGGR